MSLSLRESCHLYDKYCRRNNETPTFQDFNSKHFTCLPLSSDVFEEYKRVIMAAKRANGIPVTRRLPSLYKKFDLYRKQSDMPDFVSENMSFSPSVQIDDQTISHKLQVPSPSQSVKMNIRPVVSHSPESLPEDEHSMGPVEAVPPAKVPVKWTREAYAAKVSESKSILLQEPSGHMIHLVPEVETGHSFESLACKLTKKTWESLRGKSLEELKMRDGSMLSMSSLSLDEGDLAEFIQNRKQKIGGPHFIRFSRI
jgi:hypothetical protein